MAEVIIDALSLEGNASASGKSTAIISSDSALIGSASACGKVLVIKTADSVLGSLADIDAKITLIVFDKTAVSGSASTATEGRALRLIRGGLSGRASVKSSGHKYKTVKAALNGESTLEAFTYDRDLKTEIGDYLPAFYRDMEDVERLTNADAAEVIRLRAYLDNLLDNFYVPSADNLLDRWEHEVGIETIPQRSTDSRRHFIEAKLRGKGTTTKKTLKEIADSFYESEVIERPREHEVEVKIVGRRGRPKNVEDMDEAIGNVIPAHLTHNITFTFLPWSELDMIRRSWDEAEAYTMASASETNWRDFEGEGVRWNTVRTLTAKELEESYNLNTGGIADE